MHPFPSREVAEELYRQERVFSAPLPANPNVGKFMSGIMEPLYRRFGAYYPFIARTCLRYGRGMGRRIRLLDVGCSTGPLLQEFAAQEPTMDLWGIDIDPRAREGAPEALRDRIIVGDFMAYDFGRAFDIVTLCFVIEHLLDFEGTLRRALEVLRPGGLLFFSTPDIGSPRARQERERWYLVNDPLRVTGHVHWFTRPAAARLARRLGCRIVGLANRGEFIHQLPVGVQRVLRALLGVVPPPPRERFIRWYPPRMIYAILFDGLLAERFGWGDCLYAFLRKGS